MKKNGIKTFVLDTNVLLHSAQSIEVFQDNDIVIPMAVVEELDKFKRNSDELGRNARRVIRYLDKLREADPDSPGQLVRGVPLSVISPAATGKLYVLAAFSGKEELTQAVNRVFDNDLDRNSPDNRILQVACLLREEKKNVVVISKDINLRLKADALGLRVMDFENGKVDSRRLYSGFVSRQLSPQQLSQLYAEKEMPLPDGSLLPNEFVVFCDETQEKKSAIVRNRGENLHLLEFVRDAVWNVSPRNKEQRMALELLLDPEVRLVTLIGGAGTGKTLLALAAALQETLNNSHYEKILVSRPIVPLGNDIGFLPGSKDNKLTSWMQPIFDNLTFLLGSESGKKGNSSRYSTETLLQSHKLELEALTYIRGRSLARQFVIVDEAQNLTPHEVKTIISRCGEDTKMVLTGDPGQIDNPYLDASSNGLCYAVERLKGQKLFGHITLARSERSTLAALAADLL